MTIRYFAILTACIAIALMLNQPLNSTVVAQSGRELDVAIVGHGYFCIHDVETDESRFTRDGNWQIDACGLLCIKIQGKSWIIEPAINIPSDWTRVAILPDGHVQHLQDDRWMSVGQIQLAKFPTTPQFADPFGANKATVDTGVPLISNAGTYGLGLLQQGWIERPSVTKLQITAHLLIASLASLLINAFLDRPRLAGR